MQAQHTQFQANRMKAYGLLALVTGILSLFTYASILAHGGGTPRLTDVEAGPYRLFAWTSPEPLRAGEIHMTIAVTLPPTTSSGSDKQGANQSDTLTEAVTDVNVGVVFEPMVADDQSPSQLASAKVALMASVSEINPLYYEVDTELAFAGQWKATISVDGLLGTAEASFMSGVEPALLVNWSLVFGIVLLLVVIILYSRMRTRSERHNS
ncbi:MAG: hypothetical protein AAF702_09125 [Chloroflexota bacterium]